MEQWLPAPGFAGIYEVSDKGRVRSVDRIDPAGRRQQGKIRKLQVAKRGGYLVVNLRKDGKTFSKKVHHLVAVAFNGPPPLPLHPGRGPIAGFCEVDHKDENKRNNKPGNLIYTTRPENIRKSYGSGSRNGCYAGERNGRAKLTAAKVRKIRAAYAAPKKTTIVKLADRFHVSKSTIGYVLSGEIWPDA
jgi:hypothetical protein